MFGPIRLPDRAVHEMLVATLSTAGEAVINPDSESSRGLSSARGRDALVQQRVSPAPRGPVNKLLRLPLFYKILMANGAVLALAVLVGAILFLRVESATGADQTLRWIAVLGGSAILVGAAASALLTRLALTPLQNLEHTASLVEEGDLGTRATTSRLADTDMLRLVTLFNRMLDRVDWYRSRQREVTLRSLESEEKARRWVARKLYDECAQALAAVLLQLRATGRRLGEDEESELEHLRRTLIEALESVRQVARELSPPELDEIGLVAALAAEVRTLSERSGIEVRLSADPIAAEVSAEAGLALYRIVHEALTNATRHSDARTVDVRIFRHADGLSAEIRDDGRGFDVDAELDRAGRGLGLLEMRERAFHVGAALSVVSSPGGGTSVLVRMPLNGEGLASDETTSRRAAAREIG